MGITAFAKGLQGGHYWHLWLLLGQKEKVLIKNISPLRPDFIKFLGVFTTISLMTHCIL